MSLVLSDRFSWPSSWLSHPSADSWLSCPATAVLLDSWLSRPAVPFLAVPSCGCLDSWLSRPAAVGSVLRPLAVPSCASVPSCDSPVLRSYSWLSRPATLRPATAPSCVPSCDLSCDSVQPQAARLGCGYADCGCVTQAEAVRSGDRQHVRAETDEAIEAGQFSRSGGNTL